MKWLIDHRIKRQIERLGDFNPKVRQRAVNALAKIGETAVPPLIDALEDKNNIVRSASAKALGKIRNTKAIRPLINIMKDKDLNVRLSAAEALENSGWKPGNDSESIVYQVAKKKWEKLFLIGKPAVEPLVDLLKDKAQDIQCAAAKTLGKIKDTRAVDPLIDTLRGGFGLTQKESIEALGEIGDAKAVDPLIDVLKNSEIEYVQNEAAIALIKIGKPAIQPLVNELNNKDPGIRFRAAETLERTGWKPGNDSELSIYLAAKRDWEILLSLGKPAIDTLINAVKYWDPYAQKEAAKILTKIGKPAVEPLINLLKDKDTLIRKTAIMILANIGDTRAVKPLINILETGDIMLSDAAGALGKIGDKTAIEPLTRILKGGNSYFCDSAAEALGEIRDPKAVSSLINTLNESVYYGDKIKLVYALVMIGDTRAVEPIVSFYRQHVKNIGYEYKKKAKKDAKKVLKKFRGKIPGENRNFFCAKCYCRAQRFRGKIPFVINIKYYTCRNCHSNFHLLEGAGRITVLLDRSFKKLFQLKQGNLTVNWFKRKEPLDFDEIWIKEADDFDVEELVMKLKNDPDNKRRKRLPKIPVYLSPNLKLSQAKMNLLNDNFKIEPWTG